MIEMSLIIWVWMKRLIIHNNLNSFGPSKLLVCEGILFNVIGGNISDNWDDWFARMLDQKVISLQIPMQVTKCLRTLCGDVGPTNLYKWIEILTQ